MFAVESPRISSRGASMSRLQPFRRHQRLAILLLCLAAGKIHAQGLKTVDNPGGGQIVYGSVVGQTTPQGAMAAALHYAHGSFGDRPQLGTIFQSKDGQTFGVGFTLTAVKLSNKPIGGLIMISMSMGQDPQAALLYDERTRFLKTQPEMLHTLSQIWAQQMQTAGASGTRGASDPVPVLHPATAGDGSGHIGLPDGWHITAMRGGQCTAEGPNGEQLGFGLEYQGINDPNIRSQFSRFNNPNASGALSAPLGGNIFASYISITNQIRRINHKAPASFQLISQNRVNPDTGDHAIEARYILDLNDGRGPRTASAHIGEVHMQGSATWMMTVQETSIPQALYDREWPTMLAIIHSYNQDVGVINAQLQQSLANTRAIGERSRQQAADADASRIASTAAFNQHMDDLSVASKVQQNYTMDRTELQDNDLALRGAIDNNVATALIKANPDRYQEVPTASFLKGVDY
jgi:hypothetical protein